MKKYRLKKKFKGLAKGTEFYLVTESEYIGVKEFVLRTKDLSIRIAINEKDLTTHFTMINQFR